MKKLVNARTYFRINGKKWIDCSIWNKIRYYEESECEEWTSRELTFAEAVDLVKKGFVPHAEVGETIFRKRTYLELPSGDLLVGDLRYYEREIKTFEVKQTYEPYNNTIKVLADLLPADQFCEYLKDRGISSCPMLK